ncbi:hypothetical protein SAMN05216369_2924 [Marinobacter antarcticus]|uniref:Uncharacterized protein n=1 Tax=Marinobacter antarcticus TaxID=564117 RepID=A0A1M6UUT7_9GAMM|nr:hypothetical protein SAMN05216369_2924 [Marinobacter antarcticus]
MLTAYQKATGPKAVLNGSGLLVWLTMNSEELTASHQRVTEAGASPALLSEKADYSATTASLTITSTSECR